VSNLALFILAAVLVPIAVGIVTGAIMRPHDPWKDALDVAAAGSGVVAAALLVAVVVGLFADQSSDTADQAAGVQAIFIVPLLLPIFGLVLVGAAIGKLLGRSLRGPGEE
jgi:ACR3 family arsenite efflux pump ArsB